MTADTASLTTWFGPRQVSLFGVLQFPADRRIRAGVVVVSPLGIEQVTTYRGVRALTGRLARQGVATLRYDHPGTGSSTGMQLSDTAWEDWQAGLASAVDFLRSQGAPRVIVLGVRAGALIASSAIASGAVTGVRLAVWDPPLSGRRYLREQTAKYRIIVGEDPTDPGVSVPGGHFSDATARCIRSARWSPGLPADLLAARPEVMSDPALEPLISPDTRTVELAQSELFTAPLAFIHHVPEPDIGQLVEHLTVLADGEVTDFVPEHRRTAIVDRRPDGSVVEEELTTITPAGLPLVITRVRGEPVRGGVVFQSTANEPAWGPTRAWVESARDNAGNGLACFRFDKIGGGEAGSIEPGEIAVLYSHASREEAVEVLRALGLPARSLLVVGLCSGAWMSAESAIRARAGAVLLFGMIQWSRVREPVTKEFLYRHGYDLENQVPPTTESGGSRIKPLARRLLPYPVWQELGRRGLTQVPGPLLADLHSAGVRTVVALTPEDDDHFTSQRGDAGLRRLRRRGFEGRIERIHAPQGDHNLYRPDTRRAAVRLIRQEADALRGRLGLRVEAQPEQTLRVLFINENIGGHATVHHALQHVLSDRPDIDAEFLDARGPGLLGRLLRAPIPGLARLDLDLQPLRGQLVHSWSVNRRVRTRLRRGDIDAAHVYTQNCMLGGARILGSVPTVITTDSTGLRNAYSIPYRTPTRFTPLTSRAVLPWERPVLHAAHHILANSVPVVDSLTSPDYGVPAESVSLLRMGIWSPYLTNGIPDRSSDRRPTIVFLGTSMDRKGGSLLLDVWRASFRDRADLLLVTLDPVPEEPGLRVVGDLTPGDDRLWELLAGSDIMCFPSTIDQAPNVVLEASAAGLPVIAHPGGAVPEMVQNGVSGLLVDGADRAAVTAALNTLVSDPALRRRMGEAGYEHVREHYNMARSADEIVRALREATATRTKESIR